MQKRKKQSIRRIAMFSWESLHSISVGGVSGHVTELAAALSRQEHKVHVFTRKAKGQRYYDLIDGVHYHRCAYQSHHDFVDDVNNMCRAFLDRFLIVEDMVGQFDVVHTHDWLVANTMIWLKQTRPHKSVQTIHSTEYGRCGNNFYGGRSARVRDQERASTYWADKLICVSHATKKEVAWMYEVPDWKIHVVYNGVSPERFEPSTDVGAVRKKHDIGPMDPTVLFCGRLEWQKGPDLLIEAIPGLIKHFSNAKFVFAGDGGMRAGIEARARRLGIFPVTRFLGFRDVNELVDIFKSSDCVCVPSRNEPFGIVVLEAWSAIKPVVVTQNGGPNEYVDHEVNGLKITPTPNSIGWGVGKMFGDFDKARTMGENGRRKVLEQFTWDTIARQTLDVYSHSEIGNTKC